VVWARKARRPRIETKVLMFTLVSKSNARKPLRAEAILLDICEYIPVNVRSSADTMDAERHLFNAPPFMFIHESILVKNLIAVNIRDVGKRSGILVA